MPKTEGQEYKELAANPEKYFLRSITSQVQTLCGISQIEVDETLEAFDGFKKRLHQTENEIIVMNGEERFKNRTGPIKMPYNVLIPSS
ncbi:hypothetical protein QQ045_007342 [Rhodiola kirilowii]